MNEEAIKNLLEIVEVSKDSIENNDINVTAVLDLEDLKSLQTVLENSIPKKKIKDKIKQINNKIKQNEKELRKKSEPVGSGFSSFDDYFKWRSKVIHENELLKEEIKDLQEVLKDK